MQRTDDEVIEKSIILHRLYKTHDTCKYWYEMKLKPAKLQFVVGFNV